MLSPVTTRGTARLFQAVAFAAFIGITPMQDATAASHAQLTVEAESQSMIWNAVAVSDGRVFVAGPRWTGSKGPSLALLDTHRQPQPYPDAGWNAWQPGSDASKAFVDVNAIHLDGHGSLWAVDTGSPEFGGDPIPAGAKLVQIALATNRVTRVIPLGPELALKGSYIDDIRFNDDHAYLTDAGKPGLIVVDLKTGAGRRVLEGNVSTTAPADRAIVLDGEVLRGPDGRPVRVSSDPMELSPDRQWLYYGPLEGPWSKIETRWLDDPALTAAELAAKVEPFADLPPVGGTTIDRNGDLYFSELATNTLRRRSPDGKVTVILTDPRLHWVDAPVIDEHHRIWLPVPQLDRVALFHGGQSKIQWPIQLYSLQLPAPGAIR